MRFASRVPSSVIEVARRTPVPWGPVGFVVYRRTYSRLREDLGRNEGWVDTVERGVQALLDYGMQMTEDEVSRLFEFWHQLKCMPAGRGLWQLGTRTVERIGSASMQNCWFCELSDIESFCFLFDMLMLGGGVGYSVLPEAVYKLPPVKEGVKVVRRDEADVDFIVTDNREGWVELLRKTLTAHLVTGRSFTYSVMNVRGKGTPIKGFGGVASGPEELVKGISQICGILDARAGQSLRPVDALDIANIIGSVVVSGNVRRSAAISIGSPKDEDFLLAKNWGAGNIPNWRAMSNNTVKCNDTRSLSRTFWSGYEGTSEPYGLFNLNLSRTHGRVKDGLNYRPDRGVKGTNPCVAPGTMLLTPDGEVPIEQRVGVITQVWNGEQWSNVVPQVTAQNQPMVRIKFDNGRSLDCTLYHRFHLYTGEIRTAEKLHPGDLLEHTGLPGPNGYCPRVIKVVHLGICPEVYCFFERHRNRGVFNGILTANCGEQSLETREGCTLVEQTLPMYRDLKEFHEGAALIYKVAKTMLLLPSHWPASTEVMSRNMRVGIGVTGVCQSNFSWSDYDEVYRHIEEVDRQYSKSIGRNRSIKLTTVKPSGTLSLLPGVTPGIHPAYAPFYLRRIRFSSDDPLVRVARQHGYPCEPQYGFDGTPDHGTTVVSFPIKTPEGALLASQTSAIGQLEQQKQAQTWWSDNAVSVTVYYRKEELPHVQHWLKENYRDNIKSCSFLLHSDHGFRQAPLEEITKEQYEELSSKTIPITGLDEEDDRTLPDSLECTSGGCPIR